MLDVELSLTGSCSRYSHIIVTCAPTPHQEANAVLKVHGNELVPTIVGKKHSAITPYRQMRTLILITSVPLQSYVSANPLKSGPFLFKCMQCLCLLTKSPFSNSTSMLQKLLRKSILVGNFVKPMVWYYLAKLNVIG